MRDYGIENFSFDILEECSTELLDEKEIYYISYYNSYHNGYNRTAGGSCPNIEMIIKARQLWDQGYCSAEIGNQLSLCKETIRKYLLGYDTYSATESHRRGALRSEKLKEDNDEYEQIKIIRYDLSGAKIDKWNSCKQIYNTLLINAQQVMSCLKGEGYSAGGFRWSYENVPLVTLTEWNDIHHNKIIPIEVINRIKEKLSIGYSQTKLAKELGVSRKTINRINLGERYNDGLKYPIYDYKQKKSNR